ncbi:MAG: hypothetical protein GY756_21605 [bacterium]|nr:hypothetical protein [bacterium]
MRNKNWIKLVLIFLILLIVGCSKQAVSSKDIDSKLDDYLNSIIEEDHPGGTALVAINGECIYSGNIK